MTAGELIVRLSKHKADARVLVQVHSMWVDVAAPRLQQMKYGSCIVGGTLVDGMAEYDGGNIEAVLIVPIEPQVTALS